MGGLHVKHVVATWKCREPSQHFSMLCRFVDEWLCNKMILCPSGKQRKRYTYNVRLRRVRVTSYLFIFCNGEVITVTYSVCLCAFVASVIQHAVLMFSAPCCIVICGISGCTVFSPNYRIWIRSPGAWGGRRRRRELPNTKCVFLIFSTTFVWDISHSEKT
jgi:hypothetical protein